MKAILTSQTVDEAGTSAYGRSDVRVPTIPRNPRQHAAIIDSDEKEGSILLLHRHLARANGQGLRERGEFNGPHTN